MPESQTNNGDAGNTAAPPRGGNTAASGDESPNTPEQVAAVVALLRGEDAPTDSDGAPRAPSSDESREKKSAPKNLAELAERLECKVSDLYALELPAAEDGKPPRKLGELKDLAARQDTLAIAELQATERHRKREADFLRAQAELDELLQHVPKDALKPEVVNAARKRRETIVERERARTLEAIPEWADDDRKTADVGGMTEFLNGYGYPPNFLHTVVDHRSLKFIRDFWQLQAVVDKALAAAVEKPPKSAHKPNGKSSNAPKPRESATPQPTSKGAQVSAIAQLLEGNRNANGTVSR